jgi:carbamoyl-phosphate synthase large subunit
VSRSQRVLVTGVAGANVGEQICKALRLGPSNHVVIGANKDTRLIPGGLVDEVLQLPHASSDHYLPRLVEEARSLAIDTVIPGSEVELLRLVEGVAELEAGGLRLLANNHGVVGLCLDKATLNERLGAAGFPTAATTVVREWRDLAQVRSYPVVTKPRVGGGGSNQVWLAQTRHELEAIATFMLADLGGFLLQEYVGTADAEYTVGVLSDARGRVVDSIALRRDLSSALSRRHSVDNRTARRELGERLVVSTGISQGAVLPHGPVNEACEALAVALGSTGPLNVQLRWVDNKPYVFEVNPRLSGTTSIRAMVGFNEPEWLLAEPLGGAEIAPARLNYSPGTVLRGLSEHLVLSPGSGTQSSPREKAASRSWLE